MGRNTSWSQSRPPSSPHRGEWLEPWVGLVRQRGFLRQEALLAVRPLLLLPNLPPGCRLWHQQLPVLVILPFLDLVAYRRLLRRRVHLRCSPVAFRRRTLVSPVHLISASYASSPPFVQQSLCYDGAFSCPWNLSFAPW